MPFMILVVDIVVGRILELGDTVEDDDVVKEAVEDTGERVDWDDTDTSKADKEMSVSNDFVEVADKDDENDKYY